MSLEQLEVEVQQKVFTFLRLRDMWEVAHTNHGLRRFNSGLLCKLWRFFLVRRVWLHPLEEMWNESHARVEDISNSRLLLVEQQFYESLYLIIEQS